MQEGGRGWDRLEGGDAADKLRGGSGRDDLLGEQGSDVLHGDDESDYLSGGSGQDEMFGGSGADRIYGGAGGDRATGGSGNDAFVFMQPTEGGDRITDFSRNDFLGFDVIRVDASSFGGDIPSDGNLTDEMFSAQDTTVAESDALRFIWEMDTTKLWFDRNGKDAGGLFLVADLQAGATFNANFLDFVA